ncbi:unnamed protein product [Adineta steineri]|uniref:Uncharacterized protein n=1 Tax=Adineta steineri TaxID=433720 RepID=A0A818UBQ6_9BILA|nr:unnamed protein product [Adineta steineri]CAF3695620.1 unnamed protein product [Adineta steineri]
MLFELNNASSSSSSSTCHMIHTYGTNMDQQRCYPLLINFAHRCCKHAQENNCLTALKHGIRQCLMFKKEIVDTDPMFANRNKNILNRKRGAGYWLWKPFILLQELYLARDGDIIVYSDAAVNFIGNISYLTKLTEDQDIVVFRLVGWKESSLTKRDALIVLDVDKPEYTTTSAGLASYIVVKRSFTSLRFVSEWLTYAQDSRVITDDDNVLGSPNYPGFRAHRHDQSILSLLAKKWKLTIYPDPSQYGEGEKSQRPYPAIFDHHRSKN